jgi:hypothetical protein
MTSKSYSDYILVLFLVQKLNIYTYLNHITLIFVYVVTTLAPGNRIEP